MGEGGGAGGAMWVPFGADLMVKSSQVYFDAGTSPSVLLPSLHRLGSAHEVGS